MIIIDYSGISMAGIIAIKSQLEDKTEKETINLIRHVIISSILSYKKKYSNKFSEVIIACDGPSYWRKEYFPNYKGTRKSGREASKTDWKMIFKCMAIVREDLVKYFPYKVIWLDKCEADDIIASLVKEYQEFGKYEEIMIISSDNDLTQLQKYDNVSQYSPTTKKTLKLTKRQVIEYINECEVKGQSKDDIPSIKQNDDFFVNGLNERATPIYKKTLEEFMLIGEKACKNETELRNYIRNKNLFNFDYIPEEVHNSVILAFDVPRYEKFDRMKLMNYLVENRLGRLLDSIQLF